MSWDRVIPQSYQNRNFLESQGNKHEQTGQEIRAGGSVSSTHLLHTRGTHQVKTAFLTQPLIFTLSEAYNQSLCVPNRNLNQAISFIFWRKEESISLIHIFKHEERLDLELVGQSGRQTFSGRTHECVWVTHTISLSCSLETRGSPKADLKLHFWVILYTDTVSFPLLFLLPNIFAITWFFWFSWRSMEHPWWPRVWKILLEKGMTTHSSILAWRISWAEEPGRLQSIGLQRVRHDWASHWKSPWCWERLKAKGEEGDSRWNGWMASPVQWTQTWADSGREWGTRRPGVLQSMGSKRAGHDLATEKWWKGHSVRIILF